MVMHEGMERLQRVWKRWVWRKAHRRMMEIRKDRYRLLEEQIRREPEEREREEMRRRKVYLKSGMLPRKMQETKLLIDTTK